MLKFYHTLIPLLLVAGCELLDNDIKMGPDRYQTEKSGIRGGRRGQSRKTRFFMSAESLFRKDTTGRGIPPSGQAAEGCNSSGTGH